MTKPTYTLEIGKFAEVYSGNMTADWLPDGDDIQARANVRCAHWLTPGKDAPIYRRGIEAAALRYEITGTVGWIIYETREGAEKALARHMMEIE